MWVKIVNYAIRLPDYVRFYGIYLNIKSEFTPVGEMHVAFVEEGLMHTEGGS